MKILVDFSKRSFLLLALIHELESLRRLMSAHEDETESESPVLVHCVSGAGRTGVLMLSQIMIHIFTHNGVSKIGSYKPHVFSSASGMY